MKVLGDKQDVVFEPGEAGLDLADDLSDVWVCRCGVVELQILK